jgi:predicted O-methyltransferase YrrM
MDPKSIVLDEHLHAYLLTSEPPEHAELRGLREVTSKMPHARMQVAPEQGHFLAFLVRLIGAHRTLELGTFTGYSALAVALALPENGSLVACDLNEEWIEVGRPYWERAGVASKIEVRIGPALVSLKRLISEGAASFDLAFVDADKEEYNNYYEGVLRLVRPGGVIVLDNTLQHGRVADLRNSEPRTISVRELNAKIAGDERVDRVLIPIGDGMTVARRRQ